MSISLYAEFSATTGNEARVTALIAAFALQVRAEPGNVMFDPFTMPGALGSFFVIETYVDEAAFQAHLASEHGLAFNVALGPLIVGGTSVLTTLAAVETAA